MANGNDDMQMDALLKGCKGSRVKMSQVRDWLLANIMDNMDRETRITLNIWSAPGVGKTSLVKSLERQPVEWNGRHWDGFKIIDIPLAQIEEMGDVLGFPVEEIRMTPPNGQGDPQWFKAVDSLIKDKLAKEWTTEGEQRTIYAPPSWVPREERPGVLLFDDGNRASQRIMKGLMQLVQDYRTISWAIPKGWTIVFTGNPDNRMNQVTDMDTAQLTRMKHVTLLPDVEEWARWAVTQKDLDIRLIQWARKNPELFTPSNAERTNPRSLTEFARALKRFPDIHDNEKFIQCEIEGNASLDEDVVKSIMMFLMQYVGSPIEVDEILTDAAAAKRKLRELMVCSEPRLDIVTISCDRLLGTLASREYTFKAEHVANIQAFLLDENMPKDQAMNFAAQLAHSSPDLAKRLLNSPALRNLSQIGRNQLG